MKCDFKNIGLSEKVIENYNPEKKIIYKDCISPLNSWTKNPKTN